MVLSSPLSYQQCLSIVGKHRFESYDTPVPKGTRREILMLLLFNILTNFIAVLLGGLVTWYFSRSYYRKAGADLVNEAAKLRHLSSIMLHAMEDAGLVKLIRDEMGEIVGRKVEASVIFEGSSTMTGDLQIKGAN